MKIEQRTCKYQYQTYWCYDGVNFIKTYGYKDVEVLTVDKAFVCNIQRKEMMEKRK